MLKCGIYRNVAETAKDEANLHNQFGHTAMVQYINERITADSLIGCSPESQATEANAQVLYFFYCERRRCHFRLRDRQPHFLKICLTFFYQVWWSFSPPFLRLVCLLPLLYFEFQRFDFAVLSECLTKKHHRCATFFQYRKQLHPL